MKFRKRKEPVYTSSLYYDLFDGGYINPHDLLESTSQADAVVDAVNMVRSFLDEAEAAGVLEEI